MRRKLLFGERMLLGDGTKPFNAVIPFRLRGTIAENDVRHALSRLQTKHPWLRALINHEVKREPYFEVPEQPVEIPMRVVARKADEDWQEESKREWHTPFNYKEQPLIRLVWIKGEDVSEMLFVFHHCLCDGGSAMTLLLEFLKVLDNPAVEIGLENPILGTQDIVPRAIRNSRRQRLKAKVIGKLLILAIKCIPLRKKVVERGNDYLIHWKLDQTLSERLIAYCKSLDVTVNTFFSATLLESFEKVRGQAAFNKVSCPVDIRRFAAQVKDDHIFAFGLMVVMSTNKKVNFSDNLRLMQDALKAKVAKLNPYLTIMVMESAHGSVEDFTKFLKQCKPSNDCMFSNLGRIQIPHQYDKFILETIFSPSVIGPLGNTTTLVTSTFRGEIDFSFIGSEGYLPYQDAIAIRDDIIRSIKQRLNYTMAS